MVPDGGVLRSGAEGGLDRVALVGHLNHGSAAGHLGLHGLELRLACPAFGDRQHAPDAGARDRNCGGGDPHANKELTPAEHVDGNVIRRFVLKGRSALKGGCRLWGYQQPVSDPHRGRAPGQEQQQRPYEYQALIDRRLRDVCGYERDGYSDDGADQVSQVRPGA